MSKHRSSSSKSSETIPPGYTIDPSSPPMLRFQASLPTLPVPTLASTLPKYLSTVRPHVSDVEFQETKASIEAFLESPVAKELQRRLEARAADPRTTNWLSDWWNHAAYMGYRDPVVVFVSYYYVHVDDPLRTTAEKRGAALVKGIMAFRELVESGQLEPEKVRGAPLCMDSYKWLFHGCRYPVKPADTARKFDPKAHNHIVFMRKNKFFKVPLAVEGGRELSASELEMQISRVIALADSTPEAIPIGALTSDNRDLWADARERLVAVTPNAKTLEEIESSMIIVCLDDTSPVTRNDISHACWVGDGRNRFYDKHQLIIFANGRSGFLGEHSCMDGTPTLRMNEFVLAHAEATAKAPAQTHSDGATASLLEPVELKFIINDEIRDFIKAAEERFDTLVGGHELNVLHYTTYGKSLITSKFKVSPDAWVQLVKQLAWYKTFRRMAVTYESAQTRKYQKGRTEVIRSASEEGKKWVEAMRDPKETNATRANLFRTAVARHLQYAAWAADGQGVDRHLFGLKRIFDESKASNTSANAKGNALGEAELPSLYTDPSYAKTSHWELSTSQLSSRYFDGWGYGEVVPDGYGLSYAIGDDYIRWTITNLKEKRNGEELKKALEEAADEVKGMMEGALKEGEGKAKL